MDELPGKNHAKRSARIPKMAPPIPTPSTVTNPTHPTAISVERPWEGKRLSAEEICIVFGVHPVIIQPGAATMNNLALANVELWEQTIIPVQEQVLASLNAWLVPMFGDDKLRLAYNLDRVPALAARRESEARTTIMLFKGGVITREEARLRNGYAPNAGEGETFASSGVAAVGGAPAGPQPIDAAGNSDLGQGGPEPTDGADTTADAGKRYPGRFRSLLVKAGRVLSARNEHRIRTAVDKIQDAADDLDGVLVQLGVGEDCADGKALLSHGDVKALARLVPDDDHAYHEALAVIAGGAIPKDVDLDDGGAPEIGQGPFEKGRGAGARHRRVGEGGGNPYHDPQTGRFITGPGGRAIKKFAASARNKQNRDVLVLTRVRNAQALLQASGLDSNRYGLERYVYTLGASEVRKIQAKHGPKSEMARNGSPPIKISDYKRLPAILLRPDKVNPGDRSEGPLKGNDALPAIKFQKQIWWVHLRCNRNCSTKKVARICADVLQKQSQMSCAGHRTACC